MLVCKDHIKKGLQLLPVPHVKEIEENENKCCEFCGQKAVFKLYIFNYEKAKKFEYMAK